MLTKGLCNLCPYAVFIYCLHCFRDIRRLCRRQTQATPDGACGISPALLGNNRCDCPGSCADENFDGVQNSATADPNPCLCQRQDGLLPADCPQNCGDEVPECPFRCQPQSDSFPGLEAGSIFIRKEFCLVEWPGRFDVTDVISFRKDPESRFL